MRRRRRSPGKSKRREGSNRRRGTASASGRESRRARRRPCRARCADLPACSVPGRLRPASGRRERPAAVDRSAPSAGLSALEAEVGQIVLEVFHRLGINPVVERGLGKDDAVPHFGEGNIALGDKVVDQILGHPEIAGGLQRIHHVIDGGRIVDHDQILRVILGEPTYNMCSPRRPKGRSSSWSTTLPSQSRNQRVESGTGYLTERYSNTPS